MSSFFQFYKKGSSWFVVSSKFWDSFSRFVDYDEEEQTEEEKKKLVRLLVSIFFSFQKKKKKNLPGQDLLTTRCFLEMTSN